MSPRGHPQYSLDMESAVQTYGSSSPIVGYIKESYRNNYSMDEQENPSCKHNWRQHLPKLIIGGGCLLLILVVSTTTVGLLSKETNQGTLKNGENHQLSAGIFGISANPTYSDETEKEILRNKKAHSTNICANRKPTDYSVKQGEEIYFKIDYETSISNDSQIIDRISYQQIMDDDEKKIVKRPTILTWSRLDDRDILKCSEKASKHIDLNCNFTDDHTMIGTADAVIFREQDLAELPKRTRFDDQMWIYNSIAPNHHQVKLNRPKDIFNLTGTYDLRSHIPMLPMQWLEKSNKNTKRRLPDKNITDETITLVIYTKDCDEEDIIKREYKDIIKELENYAVMEWYGTCNRTDTNVSELNECFELSSYECFKRISNKTRFALIFETSNVTYIPETFFEAINYYIIPIVFGSSRLKYDAVSPEESFIYYDCDDFKADELKDLLNPLIKDRDKLNGYFQWLENENKELMPYIRWYCQVCRMVQRRNGTNTIVQDIKLWI